MSQLRQLKQLIRASSLFDSGWYLRSYPDVARSGMDAAEHYLLYGWLLDRDPSNGFSTQRYLTANPDVARGGINPLVHFLLHGRAEGRQPFPGGMGPESQIKPLGPSIVRRDDEHASVRPRWRPTIPVLDAIVRSSSGIAEDLPSSVVRHAKQAISRNAPRISVIMPTWNRAFIIRRAIDSALKQSFAPFEIIVSDDGSTDDTMQVVRRNYANEMSSGLVKLIANEHRGVSAARNTALRAASGDLFCYLDSDNEWREHYLLIVAAAFEECEELSTSYCALKSHELDSDRRWIRGEPYDRKALLHTNFIDLNVFANRRALFDQFGGFDESLDRLVDWDLIIRYTKHYQPAFIPFVAVDYHLSQKSLQNITYSAPLESNRNKIYRRNFVERAALGLEQLRIAYFVYDFPALSQTFVLNELRWFVRNGYDIKVYYAVDPDASAVLDFDIERHRVVDSASLAALLQAHQRNICHSHFVYPGVTRFVWPACNQAGIHFTFMPHAVDIFHHDNQQRNRIGEIAKDELCLKVFVYGDHHRNFLAAKDVPQEKIAYAFQAIDPEDFDERDTQRPINSPLRGVVFARFIEKKGIRYLLDAAKLLADRPVSFDIYGYGPLESSLKQHTDELELTNVRFRGAVNGKEQLASVYRDADFLVAPCVEAESGDMDGFPTVILEAMAAGIPVIATRLSAIPDYLRDGVEAILARPGDADDLCRAVRRLLDMSSRQRTAMIARARSFLRSRVGTAKTTQTLLDTWRGYSVDLILVTFNREGYDDRDETYAIISRLLARTTSNFTLTIVDNGSDHDFWQGVVDRVRGNSSVRLVRRNTNALCGPATNTALEMASGEMAIYVCSKEGFVKDHGWERGLIEYMRSHPSAVMAGHKVHLPKFTYGAELARHPEFEKFRNREFALANPRRPFGHVQGGLFITRRELLLDLGGFNPLTPQANMDVEMSYYLESKGHPLGQIPELASVTVKTLPRLFAILDERTVAAHPLTNHSVSEQLDALLDAKQCRCNVCSWSGPSFQGSAHSPANSTCPKCGSTPYGRLVFRVLANDHRIYRDGRCALLSRDSGLAAALSNQMFHLAVHEWELASFAASLARAAQRFACVILDTTDLGDAISRADLESIAGALETDGEILLSSNGIGVQGLNLVAEHFDLSSERLAFDWRGVTRLVKTAASA